jgi:hypothetical protein
MNAARRRPFPLLYFRRPGYKAWVYLSLPCRQNGAVHTPLGPFRPYDEVFLEFVIMVQERVRTRYLRRLEHQKVYPIPSTLAEDFAAGRHQVSQPKFSSNRWKKTTPSRDGPGGGGVAQLLTKSKSGVHRELTLLLGEILEGSTLHSRTLVAKAYSDHAGCAALAINSIKNLRCPPFCVQYRHTVE